MTTPKIVHFVWVGSMKTIPKARLKLVERWIAFLKSKGFKYYFWIDPLGTNQEQPEMLPKQEVMLTQAGIEKEAIKDIAEIKNEISMQIIRYEIDKLRPNYGTASDLIRYEILKKYGGVYLDSDIDLPDDLDSTLYGEDAFWQKEGRTSFYRGGGANDIIISPPNSDALQKIISYVQANYRTSQYDPKTPKYLFGATIYAKTILQAYASDTKSYIIGSTLHRTGTDFLNLTLEEDKELKGKVEKNIDELKIRKKLTKSATDWIGVGIKKCEDINLAISLIMKSIDFEVRNFGILRLKEHFNYLNAQIGINIENREESQKIFFCELEKLFAKIKENIKVVQYDFDNEIIKMFCDKNKIFNKSQLLNFNEDDNLGINTLLDNWILLINAATDRVLRNKGSEYFTLQDLQEEVASLDEFLVKYKKFIGAQPQDKPVIGILGKVLQIQIELKSILDGIEVPVTHGKNPESLAVNLSQYEESSEIQNTEFDLGDNVQELTLPAARGKAWLERVEIESGQPPQKEITRKP